MEKIDRNPSVPFIKFLTIILFFGIVSNCLNAQYIRTEGPHEGYFFEVSNENSITYICASSGIYKTRNNGKDFSRIDIGISYYHPRTITADENEIFMLYYETYYPNNNLRFSYSPDEGQTWQKLPMDKEEKKQWDEIIYESGVLLARNYLGELFESTDKGQSWKKIVIDNIQSIESNSKYFFAFTNNNVILRRPIHSIEWDTIFLGRNQFSSIYANESVLFYLSDNYDNWVSIDDGLSWERSNFPKRSAQIFYLADFGKVLYVFEDETLFESIDFGKTWLEKKKIPSKSLQLLNVLRVGKQMMGDVYLMGLVASSDFFETYVPSSNGMDAASILLMESRDSFIYASSFNNIYKFKIHENTWTKTLNFTKSTYHDVFFTDDKTIVREIYPSRVLVFDKFDQLYSVDSVNVIYNGFENGHHSWYHFDNKIILEGRAGYFWSNNSGLTWDNGLPDMKKSGIDVIVSFSRYNDSLLVLGYSRNLDKMIMSITKDLETWFPFETRDIPIDYTIGSHTLICADHALLLVSADQNLIFNFELRKFIPCHGIFDANSSGFSLRRLLRIDNNKLLYRCYSGNYVSEDNGLNWSVILDEFFGDGYNLFEDICRVDSFIYYGSDGVGVLKQNLDNFANSKTDVQIYFDENLNHQRDTNERGIQAGFIKIKPSNYIVNTNSQGFSSVYISSKTNDSIEVINTLKHGTCSPSSIGIEFGKSQYNFAYQVSSPIDDIGIQIIQTNSSRPGFKSELMLFVTNHGTRSWSGELSLNYDQIFSDVVSDLIPLVNLKGLLKWHLDSIQAFQTKQIRLQLYLPDSIPINRSFKHSVEIDNPLILDSDYSDNTYTLENHVVGSYDPNQISVNKSSISREEYWSGTNLEYLVQFQNTGNYPAEIVQVKINLASFHPESIQILAASHPYVIDLQNDPSKITFSFDMIHLADSTSNESLSHGFIKFRISPRNDYLYENKILCSAAIVFDFNPEVLTDFAVTQIVNSTEVKDPRLIKESIELIPNPADEFIKINLSEFIPEFLNFQLMNSQGQLILEQRLSQGSNVIKLEDVPSGLYIIHMKDRSGWSRTKKLLIVH